jgi:DNA-directed RNA polymerase subunit F
MRAGEQVLRAVQQAQHVLGRYIEHGPRDAKQTVEELLAVLDTNELAEAVAELEPTTKSQD